MMHALDTPTAATRIYATGQITATPTITPTLAPEWGVDSLCRCHVPPLAPGSPECERLKAEYVRDVLRARASQTALARGTETPTPTATLRPTLTVAPTEEPTPTVRNVGTSTQLPTVSHTPTARLTCRVAPSWCARRIYLPRGVRGRK